MRFTTAIAQQGSVNVIFYDSNMSQIKFYTAPAIGQSEPTGFGVNIDIGDNVDTLVNARFMSITIIGNSLPYRGPVYAFFTRTSGGGGNVYTVLPNHSQHMGVYDIKDAGQIADSSSQAFVLAQSLLLTAEMSDINNGGMLSIARVPAASPIGMDSVQSPDTIMANNWYEWLASLANNSYDGPVKDGGYSFYLPEDETGYFYRPIDNYFSKELPYLAAEFTVSSGLAEAAIVRIKVTTIVQFTTTASIYDQRPSCHLMELDLLHHIMSVIPASYSNDGHKEGLKKALKSIGYKAKNLLKNPKTYTTTAKALMTLATLL